MKTPLRKSKHSLNVTKEVNPIERNYLEATLRNFISKEAVYNRTCPDAYGWSIETDYTTRMRTILLDYILDLFTLEELYIVFYENQSCYYLDSDIIKESKQNAIENINNDETLTMDKIKRLKRKVWDLNPILFGLIHELIQQSDLFWDAENEEIVYPDFNKLYASNRILLIR